MEEHQTLKKYIPICDHKAVRVTSAQYCIKDMPEDMAKRKRETSVSEVNETPSKQFSAKRDKKQDVEKNKSSVTEKNTLVEEAQLNGDEDKKTENPSKEAEASTSISDEKLNGKVAVKRKREDSEDTEAKEAKQLKIDIKKEEPARNDSFKNLKAKKIFHKRISRNECVCTPVGKPLQKPEEETEAHIQVEEWRLHKFQSPIELKHEDSIHHDHFEPLEFHGHWDDNGEATLSNNGFTATLRFYNRELPLLKGGPLHEDEYIFEQLHFHWSEDDHSGCEHIFEGRAFSMEAHAVHFNQKYEDFKQALDKPDGLAVVAFFIQATDNEDNPCFSKLSTAVKDIIKINTTTNVPTDCLTWFQEEAQCKGYYTYQGSLTTEPYTESVTWILYPQPIHVSREQVASFRSLNSTPCEQHNIKKNVRPIQTPPEHKKLNVFFVRSHRHSNSE